MKKVSKKKSVKKNDLLPKKPNYFKPVVAKKVYAPNEIFGLVDLKIISVDEAREMLGLLPRVISERHPVSMKAVGEGGKFGLLNLFADGSVLFTPKNKSINVKCFPDTGLTFTIEPVSLQIDKPEEDDKPDAKIEDDRPDAPETSE